jgi:HK97 family phage major capsid protein
MSNDKKNIKALREEYNTLVAEANAALESATPENFSAEQKTANDSRFARMESIKSILDTEKKLASFAIENDKAVKAVEPEGYTFAENAAIKVAETHLFDAARRSEVINFWATKGQVPQKFATVTTATASGLLLPKQVGQPITPTVANVFRAAHVLAGVDVYRTPGTQEIDLPVLDPSAGGALAENAVASTIAATDQDNAPTFAESIKLKPSGYHSGPVWYSNQQLAAVDFDLLGASIPTLEYNKELGFESTKIAVMKADGGITQTVTTPTGAGGLTLTYGNLVSLNRALPKRYDGTTKVIVLSKAAFIVAEALVNGQGTPVLVQDPQNGNLKRFNGTPVLYSDYLDAMGLTKFIGFVFSLTGARMRETTQDTIERYSSVPQRPGQQGFDYISYMDFGYAPSAVAKLMTPGT